MRDMVIPGVLMGVVLTLAIDSLTGQGKRPPRRDVFSGDKIMFYGWIFRLAAVTMLLGSAVPAPIVITLHPESFPVRAIVLMACGCTFFSTLSACLVVESIWSRTAISDQSITSYSPWRLARTLQWADVVEVAYLRWSQTFRVTDNRGETISISPVVCGAAEFAGEVRARLAPEVYQRAPPGFAAYRF